VNLGGGLGRRPSCIAQTCKWVYFGEHVAGSYVSGCRFRLAKAAIELEASTKTGPGGRGGRRARPVGAESAAGRGGESGRWGGERAARGGWWWRSRPQPCHVPPLTPHAPRPTSRLAVAVAVAGHPRGAALERRCRHLRSRCILLTVVHRTSLRLLIPPGQPPVGDRRFHFWGHTRDGERDPVNHELQKAPYLATEVA